MLLNILILYSKSLSFCLVTSTAPINISIVLETPSSEFFLRTGNTWEMSCDLLTAMINQGTQMIFYIKLNKVS